MNASIMVLFAIVAYTVASPHTGGYGNDHYRHYGDGFRRTYDGVETPYNNAGRQLGVNYLAEKVGASSGTARFYGVPGTGHYFGAPNYYNNGYYGGYRGYGYNDGNYH